MADETTSSPIVELDENVVEEPTPHEPTQEETFPQENKEPEPEDGSPQPEKIETQEDLPSTKDSRNFLDTQLSKILIDLVPAMLHFGLQMDVPTSIGIFALLKAVETIAGHTKDLIQHKYQFIGHLALMGSGLLLPAFIKSQANTIPPFAPHNLPNTLPPPTPTEVPNTPMPEVPPSTTGGVDFGKTIVDVVNQVGLGIRMSLEDFSHRLNHGILNKDPVAWFAITFPSSALATVAANRWIIRPIGTKIRDTLGEKIDDFNTYNAAGREAVKAKHTN